MLTCKPITFKPNEKLLFASNRDHHPVGQEAYSGVRESIRQRLKMSQVPSQSMDIMLSSLSDSTLKNYDGTLKKWWQFCAKKNSRPLDPNVPDVLEFLTQEFHKGLSHSTLTILDI